MGVASEAVKTAEEGSRPASSREGGVEETVTAAETGFPLGLGCLTALVEEEVLERGSEDFSLDREAWDRLPSTSCQRVSGHASQISHF